MQVTFKTALENNSKNIAEPVTFTPKNANLNSNYYTNLEDTKKQISKNSEKIYSNSFKLKKSLESKFLNTYCGSDKKDKCNFFNTKGINIQTTNYENNHLNIDVNKLTIRGIEEYLINKELNDISSNKLLKELTEIDERIDKLKGLMQALQKKEMERLIKEFNVNDYERRFKTTKFKVISALIGEDNAQTEMSRQNRENKVINVFILIYYFQIFYKIENKIMCLRH